MPALGSGMPPGHRRSRAHPLLTDAEGQERKIEPRPIGTANVFRLRRAPRRAATSASAPDRRAVERSPPGASFNPTLHGARGFFALLVFVFHIAASGAPGFEWQGSMPGHAALVSLQFGVEIFFCISGYVVVGSLARAKGPADFLWLRAIRLLPVLWATLAIVIPLGVLTRHGAFAGPLSDLWWVLPANLLPLAGVLPLPVLHFAAWSLSYETMFYLIAAAIWWIPARHRAARLMVYGTAILLLAWHPRALFFAVGVGTARSNMAAHPGLRVAARRPGLLLVGFFASWYAVQFGGPVQDGSLLDWVRSGRAGLAAIAIGASVAAFAGLVAGQGGLATAFRHPALQRIGTLSYSLYMWSIIVIGIVKRGLGHMGYEALVGPWCQILLLALCLPLTLLVAELSVRLIERQNLAWLWSTPWPRAWNAFELGSFAQRLGRRIKPRP